MTCYQAAVIGLGKIGQLLDIDVTDDARVATHARGFASHAGYELLAGVDPLAENRQLFERKYRRPAYPDLASMLGAGHRPEVCSIAVPTLLHARVFEAVIAIQPIAILCEKPLAARVVDAEIMVAAALSSKCVLAANYMRRFDPGVLSLRQLIAQGAVGDIYKGSAWYSKGLLNNGSHLIDLLTFLLGEAGEIRVLQTDRAWDGQDPEPDIYMLFGPARLALLAAREECFSHMGFELVGTRGHIRYADGGLHIEVRRTRETPELPGYHTLSREAEILPSDLKRYQWHTVNALHHHLDEGAPLHSDGVSALATLRTVERVRAAILSPQEST